MTCAQTWQWLRYPKVEIRCCTSHVKLINPLCLLMPHWQWVQILRYPQSKSYLWERQPETTSLMPVSFKSSDISCSFSLLCIYKRVPELGRLIEQAFEIDRFSLSPSVSGRWQAIVFCIGFFLNTRPTANISRDNIKGTACVWVSNGKGLLSFRFCCPVLICYLASPFQIYIVARNSSHKHKHDHVSSACIFRFAQHFLSDQVTKSSSTFTMCLSVDLQGC